MKNDLKLRVYDVLARAFIQEEVRTCFALLGDANMNWAARLAEQGCRMIYVRHEHCALASAMAYARKNREVGVATVTCGPGVTQLITALPAAVRAHLPLVVFAGEAPLKSGWYNQELDQAPRRALPITVCTCRSVCRWRFATHSCRRDASAGRW